MQISYLPDALAFCPKMSLGGKPSFTPFLFGKEPGRAKSRMAANSQKGAKLSVSLLLFRDQTGTYCSRVHPDCVSSPMECPAARTPIEFPGLKAIRLLVESVEGVVIFQNASLA